MALVQIIHCYSDEEDFSNLTYNSKHNTVDPPKGKMHKPSTVWVMGSKGKPVKLYSNEFKRIHR